MICLTAWAFQNLCTLLCLTSSSVLENTASDETGLSVYLWISKYFLKTGTGVGWLQIDLEWLSPFSPIFMGALSKLQKPSADIIKPLWVQAPESCLTKCFHQQHKSFWPCVHYACIISICMEKHNWHRWKGMLVSIYCRHRLMGISLSQLCVCVCVFWSIS